MPYSEKLVRRIEKTLDNAPAMTHKKMFGGVCFLLHGNMCFGVEKDRLMVRVGPDGYEDALKRRHVHPMDFTGRPLKGFVFVEPSGLKTATQLKQWLEKGLTFAATLPRKW